MKELNKVKMNNNKIIVEDNFIYFNNKKYPCSIGKNGLTKRKKEGDKKTPTGCFKIRRIFYRNDRMGDLSKINKRLDFIKIEKSFAWSEDVKDNKNYNSLVFKPHLFSADPLWRRDNLYDVVVELGYNDKPAIPGKGSAIFFHIARKKYTATDGCVATHKFHMKNILKDMKKDTIFCITD